MTSTVPAMTATASEPPPGGAAHGGPGAGDAGNGVPLDQTADRHGPKAETGTDGHGPVADLSGDRPARARRPRDPVRSWPLLILAAPAAVAVWSGWIGIGQLTGFGQIHPLPGIWNSFHIDTAVTLPIGLEAYAAFALRAWLTSSPVVSDRTRRFARSSAITALALGMAGQAAYHLLTQAGITRAPWEVTPLVSALPVLVLGLDRNPGI